MKFLTVLIMLSLMSFSMASISGKKPLEIDSDQDSMHIDLDGRDSIFMSANDNNVEAVEHLLEENPKLLNVKTPFGHTLFDYVVLKYIVTGSYLEVAEFLRKKGAYSTFNLDKIQNAISFIINTFKDVKSTSTQVIDSDSKTNKELKYEQEQIHDAITNNDTEAIEKLLKKNPKILNVKFESHTTSLDFAIVFYILHKYQSLNMMEFLKEKGAHSTLSLDAIQNAISLISAAKTNEMHDAILSHDTKTVKKLLTDNPELVRVKNKEGKFLFHIIRETWSINDKMNLIFPKGKIPDLNVKDKNSESRSDKCRKSFQ